MKHVIHFITGACLTLFLVQSAQAQLLNENFDYGTTNGNLTAVSSSNWGETASAAGGRKNVQYIAGTSLTSTGFGSGTAVGGSLRFSVANGDGADQDVNRVFGTASVTTGSVYVAALVRIDTTGSDYFFHLGGERDPGLASVNGATFRLRLSCPPITGSTFNFQLDKHSSGNSPVATSVAYNTGTTYLVVMKYEIIAGGDNDAASLWVFNQNAALPTTEALAGTPQAFDNSGTDAASVVGNTGLRTACIRQDAVGSDGNPIPRGNMDGLRVATTWSEALGLAVAEPSLSLTLPANPVFIAPTTASPSPDQSFTVAGTNLGTTALTVTAPANWQISDGAGAFTPDADGVISYTPTAGAVSTQTVKIRFNPSSINQFGDAVVTVASGTASQTFGVTGFSNGTIGAVRAQQATFIPANTVVTVAGRVTSLGDFFSRELAMQDITGAITVTASVGDTILPLLAVGDSLSVTGPVGERNASTGNPGSGYLQIATPSGGTATTLTKVGTTNVVQAPRVVTLSQLTDENLEGRLVRVQNAALSRAGFAAERNYNLADATNSAFVMRIDADTDIDDVVSNLSTNPPGSPLIRTLRPSTATTATNGVPLNTVTGILYEFQGTPQLQPRDAVDFSPAPVLTDSNDYRQTTTANFLRVTSPDSVLLVGSWNVENFGNTGGPSNETNQLTGIVDVLRRMQPDIVGIQEINSATQVNLIVSGLNTALGANTYSGILIDHASSQDQRLAIIYRNSQIDLVANSARSVFFPTSSVIASTAWASSGTAIRFPVQAEFLFKGVPAGQPPIPFVFVNVHGNSGGDAVSRTRRLTDYTQLRDTLVARFPTQRVILVGDFNDQGRGSIAGPLLESPLTPLVSSGDFGRATTVAEDLGLFSFNEGQFTNMLDHILYSNEIGGNFVGGTCYPIWTPNLTTISNPFSNVADHMLVIAAFEFAQTVTDVPNRQESAMNVRVYPNPIRSRATVQLSLTAPEVVIVEMLSTTGARVATPISGQRMPAGENQELVLDLPTLAPGLYLLRVNLQSSGKSQVQKVLISR